jgi:UDPglucose 6-dehydrogenase
VPEKVELINQRISPIDNKEIKKFFKAKELQLKATTDKYEAYENTNR